ncbi:MAG: glycosyltransferase [Brachybacterium sp.]|nr:glycosyltransferase [Brachybacterium sp.]
MTAPVQGTEPFSVLMPLYQGDRAQRAEDALRSATTEQTLRPDHLVLAVDGPLPSELESLAGRVADGEFGPSTVLRHPRHRGLAPVLQDALEAMPTDVVVRADADDLCRPERFALQVPRFTEHRLDLLGGAMQEFSDTVPRGTGPLRRRPLGHDEIRRYLPTHSPFHHPTMTLRVSTALAAGGYRELPFLEDYWLWERMLLAGARTENLPDVLVDYRVDEDLFARRGGWRMMLSDMRLQRIFLADGIISAPGCVRNLVMRSCYRLAPGSLRRLAYRTLVETAGIGQRRRRRTT